MIGGCIYFTLLSTCDKTFLTTDLTDPDPWEEFDKAVKKPIELFQISVAGALMP